MFRQDHFIVPDLKKGVFAFTQLEITFFVDFREIRKKISVCENLLFYSITIFDFLPTVTVWQCIAVAEDLSKSSHRILYFLGW